MLARQIPYRQEVEGLVRGRKFRVDFLLPPNLVVEVEGLTPGPGGRHQRIGGYTRDLEKYNGLAECGYTVLRYSQRQIRDGSAIQQIERVLTRLRGGGSVAGPAGR